MDPGFVITKINDKKITNLAEALVQLEEISKMKKKDRKVMLEGIYEGYPDLWYYAFPI